MRKLAGLVLALCTGCAGMGDYITEDSVLADMSARFSSAPRYAPASPVSAPAFYPDMVPEAAQAPRAPAPAPK